MTTLLKGYFKELTISFIIFSIFCLNIAAAQTQPAAENKTVSDFSVGSTSYLQYQAISNSAGLNESQFLIPRAYLTLKKSLLSFLDFRITTDIYTDKTGSSNTGSLNARLKYAYTDFKTGDFLIFTKPDIEFGLVHTPWLDWEEHLNYYRMEGTMFLERNEIFNSADFGITFTSLLGGQMSDEYKKEVNGKYPGKYGSIQFGIYNGSGYNKSESNTNKTFQGRLSLRPLTDILPGLQLTYFGIYGQGSYNSTILKNPDWQTNNFMLSFEHEYFVFTGQYVMGKGDKSGSIVTTADSNSSKYNGYSLFGELKALDPLRVIVRFDCFTPNKDKENVNNKTSNRYIFGVAYNFGKNCILLLNLDKKVYQGDGVYTDKVPDENSIFLTMQVDF